MKKLYVLLLSLHIASATAGFITFNKVTGGSNPIPGCDITVKIPSWSSQIPAGLVGGILLGGGIKALVLCLGEDRTRIVDKTTDIAIGIATLLAMYGKLGWPFALSSLAGGLLLNRITQ